METATANASSEQQRNDSERHHSGRDYLAEYDAAAEMDKYALVQQWIRDEPLPFFKQLRAEQPVLETPECTLVANFVDVRDMLQMPKIFTVDLYKPKMGVTGPDDGYLMAHDDDALHYREKSIMQGLLNREDLPRVRQLVAKNAAKVLSQANGEIELVNDYCRRVPVQLVQQYFGLDGVDEADLIRWSYWNQYDAFNNQPFDNVSDEDYQRIVDYHNQASKELVAYIAVLMGRKLIRSKVMALLSLVTTPIKHLLYALVGKRPPKPVDTLVMRMLKSKFAQSADFPLTRVGTNAGGLLIGAVETTSQAVAQIVEFLIERPLLLKKAKDLAHSEDTEAFDKLVWEALRFVPIRPDIFRKASCDYTMGKGTDYETEIKKGTIVRLLIHSAMFDEFAFENPDEFETDRNFYHNFAFGFGPHQCLGKYVGMEMIPEMVRQVVMMQNLGSDDRLSYVNELFPDRQGPFPEKYAVRWSGQPQG